MGNEKSVVRVHILHCGKMLVSEKVPYGSGITLKNAASGLFERPERRVELPVSAYLIEHPRGKVLVDTGWSREISPNGEYDAHAAKGSMPDYLVRFYHPWVEKGQTVTEQLAQKGMKPEDIDIVLLTHLDADHISGLRSVSGAKRLLTAQEERWWTNRTVYRLRQPENMWWGLPLETFWYKGTMEGPLWWSYDLFGDESVTLVCLPGHTDGMFAVRVKNGGRFVLLCSDAAYSERSWREGVLPGFGFNEKAIRKSHAWIREQSEDPGCIAVIANHDPAVKPQVIEL